MCDVCGAPRSQLGSVLFGRCGRIFVDAILISCQLGSSCAFVVFVADCIHSVLPDSWQATVHVSMLIALLFPLLCALALPRNTTYLAPTSHLGNVSLVVGVTTVMVYGFRNQTVAFDGRCCSQPLRSAPPFLLSLVPYD